MINIFIGFFNKNHFIKSWVGFFFGMFCVAINVLALLENFTLARIFSTLGFLCFWYPWSQIVGWNGPIKNFLKASEQPMGSFARYLSGIATVLMICSTLMYFISSFK